MLKLKEEYIYFSYGARYKTPTVFAKAKVLKVQIKALEDVLDSDIEKLGEIWKNRDKDFFIADYKECFKKEFEKNYNVVWVYFEVVDLLL
ncbi:MAG: hypothetical protein ACK5LV_04935 [Lachnospirales bacterium]